MKKYHYVYHSYEEWGREYIGCRTCDCLPEEDTKYFGSFRNKTFFPTEKTILFVCETREEAAEIEIELHDFFDVAVNPKFANQAKATSTKFDVTGVPHTEETKKKMSEAHSGKTHTEETKKKLSEANSGEKNPRYGVPRTQEVKKKISEAMLGALNSRSKAIIAIQPDGTQEHFGGICEAARELKMDKSNLSTYLESGHVLTQGRRKGWQFLPKNSEKKL